MIVAYDVGIERVNKVKAFLRMHLTWIQNSLFEGEVSESRKLKVMQGVKELANQDKDAVVFYLFPNKKALERSIIGIEKGSPDEVVL